MPRDNRATFLRQLDEISPKLRRAFERAIAQIANSVRLADLEARIEANDVDGAFDVIRMDPAAFNEVRDVLDEALRAGGKAVEAAIPLNVAPVVQFRFDGRHTRAEAWARDAGSRLITEITGEAREVVRAAIRAGIEDGSGARRIATQLIGKVDGNARKGGVIGLHSRQAAAVRAARDQLGSLDNGYFQRARRDKRFDRTVAKAIRTGKPLTRAQIDTITGRYGDRLLQLRGETIARTETLSALNQGRAEAARQMVEDNKVPADAVTMVWNSTPSGRTRDSHAQMNGQTVPLGQPFVSPVTGARMMHPGDTSLGAPGEETINCRCSATTRVDWTRLAV